MKVGKKKSLTWKHKEAEAAIFFPLCYKKPIEKKMGKGHQDMVIQLREQAKIAQVTGNN